MKRSNLSKLSNVKISSLKLNALLDLTKSINQNVKTKNLLLIFEEVLKSKLGIGKLMLFNFNLDDWHCLLNYGFPDGSDKIDVENDLIQYREISLIKKEDSLSIHSFEIVIPVYHKNQALAYLLLGDLLEDDLQISPIIKHLPFIQTLTNILIVAIENKRLYKRTINQAAMEKELELASDMQKMLFPESLPNEENVCFNAFYLPHQDIGGDYYDFIWLNENEFIFCMGDVSGKGVAAALLMSNFQASLRILVNYITDLKSLVIELNKLVNQNAKSEKFITFFIAKYNRATKELFYVNAGHNHPLLFRKDDYFPLFEGTTGLGMFDVLPSIEQGCLQIDSPVNILLYTDGAIEAENEIGDSYGLDRMIAFFKENASKKPEEINQILINDIYAFKGKKSHVDDIAVLTGHFF